MTGEEILENSLCAECVHRFSRLILPYNLSNYEFNDDELEELTQEQDEGAEILIEEHVCLVLYEPLDCKVLECSRFKNTSRETINRIIAGIN